MRNKPNCLNDLQVAGFNYEDACALCRIAMTLHRWHELECGDSNGYASWCITRGNKRNGFSGRAGSGDFIHDENGRAYLEQHPHNGPVVYTPIPDRERGALKRLEKIMARYPGFAHYVQGDPRGASLYILRPTDLNGSPYCLSRPNAATTAECQEWLSANYSRGIAVFK